MKRHVSLHRPINRPAHGLRIARRHAISALLITLSLVAAGSSRAAPDEAGRLFYTPAQRAQLENARTHPVTQRGGRKTGDAADRAPAPLRFDGVVIRSDGRSTHWLDGKPQAGVPRVSGLRPGQIRADGKVYEPYQVLRPVSPVPAESGMKEAAP